MKSKNHRIALQLAVFSVLLANSACKADCPNPITVNAHPDNWMEDLLNPTPVWVNAGDSVFIAATGSALGTAYRWNVGFGSVAADGHPRQGNDGCLVDAPIGSLIGRIGSRAEGGRSFFVGSKTTIIPDQSGLLYLGANDNAEGDCTGMGPGSCSTDNTGRLRVCISTARAKAY